MEQGTAGEELLLVYQGKLDEDVDLSFTVDSWTESLVIDLQEMTGINSCGLKNLILWMRRVSPHTKISLRNCPTFFIEHINLLDDYIFSRADVESFYVPYKEKKSGNVEHVLFRAGKEFKGSVINLPKIKHKSKKKLVLQADQKEYFRFLKRAS